MFYDIEGAQGSGVVVNRLQVTGNDDMRKIRFQRERGARCRPEAAKVDNVGYDAGGEASLSKYRFEKAGRNDDCIGPMQAWLYPEKALLKKTSASPPR